MDGSTRAQRTASTIDASVTAISNRNEHGFDGSHSNA
jgi:hypothetical protein